MLLLLWKQPVWRTTPAAAGGWGPAVGAGTPWVAAELAPGAWSEAPAAAGAWALALPASTPWE